MSTDIGIKTFGFTLTVWLLLNANWIHDFPSISCQYLLDDISFSVANVAHNTILFHGTWNYSLRNLIMQMFFVLRTWIIAESLKIIQWNTSDSLEWIQNSIKRMSLFPHRNCDMWNAQSTIKLVSIKFQRVRQRHSEMWEDINRKRIIYLYAMYSETQEINSIQQHGLFMIFQTLW